MADEGHDVAREPGLAQPVEPGAEAGPPPVELGERNAAHSRSSPPPGGAGAGENPHMPVTSVVTPWRTLASADGQASSAKSEWACMSMKPGATMHPVASTT